MKYKLIFLFRKCEI